MKKEKSHSGIINAIICIILIFVTFILYSKYIGTKGLIVKEYMVGSDILTTNFNGIKIVHFSDLLYKSSVNSEDLKDMVKKINTLKPDIVVFTGNLVTNNRDITSADMATLVSELSKINAKIDKYAIYGENDYSYNDFDTVMSNSGFKILNNSYDEIYYNTTEPMYIVGFPSTIKQNADLTKMFEFYNDENRKYIICLVHEGDAIKLLDESEYEVDLILGGYSLNGSVVLPFFGGLFKEDYAKKYSEEEYIKGITHIYISSGIGTNNRGLRFLNKPSINLYRLKSQQ